jgi:hypothetical protein
LEIVTTTSPVPPGYMRLVADGDATALIVRFEIEADWPSPEDPEFSPTTQFVAAYAPTPARRMPHTADTIFVRRVYRKDLLTWVVRCTCRISLRQLFRRALVETSPLLIGEGEGALEERGGIWTRAPASKALISARSECLPEA